MDNRKTQTKIDRRTFLNSAAAATAGLTFSPMILGETSTKKKPDDINVALLGAGAQGRILVNSCLKIPSIRFKAICDIWQAFNLKRVSRVLKAYKHEHNTYVDYREMLDKEKKLDAVIIATPDFCHSEHTVACLQAGLHVYCETAMSNTIQSAREMVEAVKRTGKLLQIGCQRRSNPRYLHCYEKLLKNNNVLGRIAAVSGQWNRIVRGPLGWPQRAALDGSTLEKYGYKSMEQFRNWRWYRGLGGGPIVSCGSHQIDVFNWFLRANPSSIIASGCTSYLDKYTHQWYDTVMAIYEYETVSGPVSAYYQILSHSRSDGYFEKCMGDRGTLTISQADYLTKVEPELMHSEYENWAWYVKEGRLRGPEEIMQRIDELTIPQLIKLLTVSETPPGRRLLELSLPVKMKKPYHQPHLENFFDAIRGKASLNCPAEIGYQSTISVLKINEAIQAGRKLQFNNDEFIVYDPDRKGIEHILGVKLPESVRNCRYYSKSYGFGSGIGWGYFEISGPDLLQLLDTSDNLPDASELGQHRGARENIERAMQQADIDLTWWKPLMLWNRQYAQKVIGNPGLMGGPQMDICVGEIRDDFMGVYLVYHCD